MDGPDPRARSELRRLVLDTSVLVAAFFSDPQSRRATRLVNAVDRGIAEGFLAPGTAYEFFNVVAQMRSGRAGRVRVATEVISAQLDAFADLRLRTVSERPLWPEVLLMIEDHQISPPDAWPLVAAIHLDAELWLTHDHADGFVAAARRLHPAVYTLAGDGAEIP